MDKPKKLAIFMNLLMKQARSNSLVQLLDNWGINEQEYDEIEDWFREELKIRL